MHLAGELTLQRTRRCACGTDGAAVDQIRDSLGLCQIEFVVQISAFGKLTGPGLSRTQFEHARQQQIEHHRSAVSVQLKYVFTRKGMRRREIKAQAFVDDFASSIFEMVQFRDPWLRHLAQQTPGEFRGLPTRNANDTDTAATRRGGNGGYRVGIGVYL